MSDLAQVAEGITQSIQSVFQDRFPSWTIHEFYARWSVRPSCTWIAKLKQGSVEGSVSVVWTINSKGASIVKVRWGISPMSYPTREMRTAFMCISEEMSHNAPHVENAMRVEIANMGDPIQVLAKKAKKSRMSNKSASPD